MYRLSMFAGLGILGLAFVVSSGQTQEKKDKPKTFLPAGFKDLKLSATQEEKIRAIGSDYKSKIDEIQKKVNELTLERNKAQFAVLTDEQKELYFKNKTGEEAKKKDAKKDAKKEEKKAGDAK